jgi:hypothetical protein
MNPLRTYMSHGILAAIMDRKGEDFDHIVEPMIKAREKLSKTSGATVDLADRRITQAVRELLDGAPPPAPATMKLGVTAVEVDMTGEQLVGVYRKRLADWGRPDWRGPVMDTVERKADALLRKVEARAAARAAEEPVRGAPFDLPAHDGDGVPLRWLGSWADGATYTPGAVVFRASALWVAQTTSKGYEPGKEPGGPDAPRAWRVLLRSPDRRPSAKDRARK